MCMNVGCRCGLQQVSAEQRRQHRLHHSLLRGAALPVRVPGAWFIQRHRGCRLLHPGMYAGQRRQWGFVQLGLEVFEQWAYTYMHRCMMRVVTPIGGGGGGGRGGGAEAATAKDAMLLSHSAAYDVTRQQQYSHSTPQTTCSCMAVVPGNVCACVFVDLSLFCVLIAANGEPSAAAIPQGGTVCLQRTAHGCISNCLHAPACLLHAAAVTGLLTVCQSLAWQPVAMSVLSVNNCVCL